VQIGALTNWLTIKGIAYGCIATKTDGTLWAWGYNTLGQLGLGDTTNRSSPVQVGSLTNWLNIVGGSYYTIAIKTDGTLWAWGSNSSGSLGLGDATNRSSPVQVGALTNWSNGGVSSVTFDFALANKTDGTLWSWGNNANGQLGLGNTGSYNSPKQVGALTNWVNIAIGGNFTLATAS
jgi:alpha-tubulin suppressor-like RCC1 family protein